MQCSYLQTGRCIYIIFIRSPCSLYIYIYFLLFRFFFKTTYFLSVVFRQCLFYLKMDCKFPVLQYIISFVVFLSSSVYIRAAVNIEIDNNSRCICQNSKVSYARQKKSNVNNVVYLLFLFVS